MDLPRPRDGITNARKRLTGTFARASGCGASECSWGLVANDPEGEARLATFQRALQQLGWIEGRNLRIDIRWGGGSAADDDARLDRAANCARANRRGDRIILQRPDPIIIVAEPSP